MSPDSPQSPSVLVVRHGMPGRAVVEMAGRVVQDVLLADVPAIVRSIDIVMGEVDR